MGFGTWVSQLTTVNNELINLRSLRQYVENLNTWIRVILLTTGMEVPFWLPWTQNWWTISQQFANQLTLHSLVMSCASLTARLDWEKLWGKKREDNTLLRWLKQIRSKKEWETRRNSKRLLFHFVSHHCWWDLTRNPTHFFSSHFLPSKRAVRD